MSGTKQKWVVVPDSHIIHHWKSAEYSECDPPETAEVGPDWYWENGTPIDSSGEDMEYVKTEILMEVDDE